MRSSTPPEGRRHVDGLGLALHSVGVAILDAPGGAPPRGHRSTSRAGETVAILDAPGGAPPPCTLADLVALISGVAILDAPGGAPPHRQTLARVGADLHVAILDAPGGAPPP